MPNLNLYKIKLGIFDKSNIFHTLFILAFNEVCKILQITNNFIKNIHKTIFVIVYYENKCVFTGGLSFNKNKNNLNILICKII